MPTYLFRNKETGEEFEEFMLKISELEPYLEANPHLEQLVHGCPGLGYNIHTKKPDDGFQKLHIRVEDRDTRLRAQLRQRVAALDHLVQFREVDLHTNGQERMRFAGVHDPGSGR